MTFSKKEADNSRELVKLALREDLGLDNAVNGDVTCELFITAENVSKAKIVAREQLIISGLEVATFCFKELDKNLCIREFCHNGDSLMQGDTLLELEGSTRSILAGERTALNFLGRLCGVATLTRRYVDALEYARKNDPDLVKARLRDTRKTTPAWRFLDKSACCHGGAENHRFGLWDAVMVKDNHLAALDGDLTKLATALARAKQLGYEVVIEADTEEQARNFAIIPDIDVILLDNMSPKRMKVLIADLCRSAICPKFEASGGISLDNLAEVARSGVDFISVGALTHSATAVDIALDFEKRI